MKKLLFLTVFLLSLFSVSGQNYYQSSPIGFGGNTTGGGTPTASNTVTVSDYATLTAALTSTANSVILVSGIIDFPKIYKVKLINKTIIGLPGATFRNLQITVGDSPTSKANSGILYVQSGSNNVIIRNLIFIGPGAYDVDGEDNLTNEGTNVWVDHCEFQDGMDGNFDNKGKADNVTVSWCKFTYLKAPTAGGSGGSPDHRFSNVVGSGPTDFPTDGRFSITFQNCYWAEGCKERMPRARNAELHILNCYYNTSISGSLAIGLGGGNNNTTCYVENSNFTKIASLYQNYPQDGGTVGLAFDNCTKGTTPTTVTGLDTGIVNKPSYTYTVLSTTDVANYIPNSSCGAGANLSVTTAGVTSTACPNLGIEDHLANADIKLYPTIVDTTINIELPETVSGDAAINIYSITGEKAFFSYNKVTPHEKLSFNVANLSKGIYLCNLKIDGFSNTWKIIKQ